MKGFVPTPRETVEMMVGKLFRGSVPRPSHRLLDPGCGNGEFIDGVLRFCAEAGIEPPSIVGVELDPTRAETARHRFRGLTNVEIRHADFLADSTDRFDYIIGNPPYVSITGLSLLERESYRRSYSSARGRFDLYLLFFEQSLRLLRENGRLVFITPEKFLYVESAAPLRALLSRRYTEELHFADEGTFGELVTYPVITTIGERRGATSTQVISRDNVVTRASLRGDASWLPAISAHASLAGQHSLSDVTRRISCGVATGADGVFFLPEEALPRELESFSHPTIAGREIRRGHEMRSRVRLLSPYDSNGELLPEDSLAELGAFLRRDTNRTRLLKRSCASRKPWYAYHDSFPISDIKRPKILCKDITEHPFFVADTEGSLVPRHSVYYIVPKETVDFGALLEYLNSDDVSSWLRSNCQRAAGGFFRVQSSVLKRLPVPATLTSNRETIQLDHLVAVASA